MKGGTSSFSGAPDPVGGPGNGRWICSRGEKGDGLERSKEVKWSGKGFKLTKQPENFH